MSTSKVLKKLTITLLCVLMIIMSFTIIQQEKEENIVHASGEHTARVYDFDGDRYYSECTEVKIETGTSILSSISNAGIKSKDSDWYLDYVKLCTRYEEDNIENLTGYAFELDYFSATPEKFAMFYKNFGAPDALLSYDDITISYYNGSRGLCMFIDYTNGFIYVAGGAEELVTNSTIIQIFQNASYDIYKPIRSGDLMPDDDIDVKVIPYPKDTMHNTKVFSFDEESSDSVDLTSGQPILNQLSNIELENDEDWLNIGYIKLIADNSYLWNLTIEDISGYAFCIKPYYRSMVYQELEPLLQYAQTIKYNDHNISIINLPFLVSMYDNENSFIFIYDLDEEYMEVMGFSFDIAGILYCSSKVYKIIGPDELMPNNIVQLKAIDVPAYTISYELDGGTNNSSNPSKYWSGSETINLADPSKDGHSFIGWYTESTFDNKVTSIPSGSSGDKTFYAKWEEKEEKIYWSLSNENTQLNISSSPIDGVDLSVYVPFVISDIPSWQLLTSAVKSNILTVNIMNTVAPSTLNSWFKDLSSIQSIDLTNLDTSNVTDMSYMFNYAKSLTSLDLSSFDTSKVTTMESMFNFSNQLKALDLSNFDTANVTDMSNMFDSCTSLATLNISNFKTSKVTDMSYMFNKCTALKSLDLSSFNTGLVTNMSYMFNNDGLLTSLDLSSFNTGLVTDMSNMFENMYKLVTITVDESKWSISSLETGKDINMFKGSSKIVGENNTTYDPLHIDSLYARIDKNGYPGYLTDKNGEDPQVSDIYWAVTESNHLYISNETISEIANETIKESSSFDSSLSFPGWYNYVGKALIDNVTIIDTINPKSLASWFENFKNLETITNFTYINTANTTNMSNLFRLCENLTTDQLNFTNFNTSKVNNMAYMFSGCTSLETLDLSGFDTSSVLDMSHMLEGLDLTSLNMAELDATKVTDMSYMFNGSSIGSLSLANIETRDVKDLSYMFASSNITTIDLASLNTPYATNMSYMFADSQVTNLDISNLNTGLVKNMSNMFKGCKMTSLDLSNFNTYNLRDMSYMFNSCINLETILVSNTWSTTNIVDSYSAFTNDTSLVGGKGTEYNSSYTNAKYACIDKGDIRPGYLTDKYDIYVPTTDTIYWAFKENSPKKDITLNMNDYSLSDISTAGEEGEEYYIISISNNNDPNIYYQFYSNSSVTEGNDTVYDVFRVDLNYRLLCTYTDDYPKITVSDKDGDVKGTTTFSTQNYDLLLSDSKIDGYSISGSFDSSQLPGWQAKTSYDETPMYPLQNIDHVIVKNAIAPKSLSSWFEHFAGLKSFDLSLINGSSVTDMSKLFSDCVNLKNVDLTNFDTSNVTDMNKIFYCCKSLTNIEMLGLNTSKVTDMSRMFYGCEELVNIDLSSFDVSSVENFSYMFSVCLNIDSLDLSNFITSSANNMSYMFNDCEKLKNINISNFDTSNVTDMSHMFEECRILPSIDLSSFDTSNVTDMELMFGYCNEITTLDLSNFNTSKVTKMKEMFSHCFMLSNINLSSFSTINVTDMNNMFYSCKSLQYLDLSSFDTSKVTNMENMFDNCLKLKTIDLSNFVTTNNTNVTRMFQFCNLLETIYVSSAKWGQPSTSTSKSMQMFSGCNNIIGQEGTKYDAKYINGDYAHIDGGVSNPGYLSEKSDIYWLLTNINNQSKLYISNTSISIPSGETKIESGSFNSNSLPTWTELDSEVIADIDYINFIDNIEPYNLNSWFEGFTSLSSIDLTNVDVANVSNTTEMFKNDSSLVTITVPVDWDLDKITQSNDMFLGCSNIVGECGQTYDDDYLDKTYARIDTNDVHGYFTKGCENIYWSIGKDISNNVVLNISSTPLGVDETKYVPFSSSSTPTWNTLAKSSKVNVINFVNKVTPNSLTNWFKDFEYLTSFNNIENLDTSKVIDMSNMFKNCKRLTTLNLSSFDTSNVTNISSMFEGCSKIRSIYLTEFNTSKLTNTSRMFYNDGVLVTICVSDGWDLTNVTESTYMFYNNTFLVGENQTTFSGSNPTDKTYARIDKTGTPGYFTEASIGIIYWKVDSNILYVSSEPIEGAYTQGFIPFRADKEAQWSKTTSMTNNVTTVEFMDNVETWSVKNWFNSIGKLSSIVNFDKLDTSNVTDMSAMFYGRNNLKSVDLSHLDTSNVTNMSGMFYGCGVTSIDISNFDLSSCVDMSYMFNYGSGIEEIILPTSPNSVNLANTSYMFNYCSKITSLDFSGFDTSSLVKANGMFNYCGSLKSIDISSFDTSNVTDMSSMFSNCKNAASIILSKNFKTNNVVNMSSMFSGCESVENLDISSFDVSSATNMTNMFRNCYKLTTLNLPTEFNSNKVTNMSNMFANCYGLKSLNLSNFDTTNVTNMSNMFGGCTNLCLLELAKYNPDTSHSESKFKTSNVTNMSNMFKNDSALKTIVVNGSEWNTDKVEKSADMFVGCVSIVGEDGTTYDSNYVDKTYARVDRAEEISDPSKGYLCSDFYRYIVGNTPCYTFKEALTIAENLGNNTVISMINDSDESLTDITISSSVTLDLNGHNLKVKGLTIFEDSTHHPLIIDSANDDEKGTLTYTSNNGFVYKKNEVKQSSEDLTIRYLPVLVGKNIYQFNDVTVGCANKTPSSKYWVEGDQALISSYLRTDNDVETILANGSGVTIGIQVKVNGDTLPLFTFSSDTNQEYKEKYTHAKPYFHIKNIEDATSITLNGYVANKNGGVDYYLDGLGKNLDLVSSSK